MNDEDRRHQISLPELLVEVKRGSVIESSHYGHLLAIDGDGQVMGQIGAPEKVTYLRSSAKPFQAIPLITSGAATRFHFSTKEIAIACGSHNGDAMHIETVKSMLEKIGLDESSLKCGTHEPYSPEAARRLRESGEKPSVLHNNCSGKHAGMLALALHLGAEITNYHQPEHPVQVSILRAISQFSGLPVKSIAIGIDGCGLPVHAVPLRSMAMMYSRLILPPVSFDDHVGAACERIVSAMMEHPEMIGGNTESLDTALMRALPGRLVAKAGAEGLFTAGVAPCERWPRGLGLALKIEDGDKGSRARRPAVMETLRQLGILPDNALGALSRYVKSDVHNHRQEIVGEAVASFKLRLTTNTKS